MSQPNPPDLTPPAGEPDDATKAMNLRPASGFPIADPEVAPVAPERVAPDSPFSTRMMPVSEEAVPSAPTQVFPVAPPPVTPLPVAPESAGTQVMQPVVPVESARTQVIAAPEPPSFRTQAMATEPEPSFRTQAMPWATAPLDIPRGPESPRRFHPWLWFVGGGATVLALLAGIGYFTGFFAARPASTVAAVPGFRNEIPPALQEYVDRAKAGDTVAMRMLAVMYYNGLSVAQNREEGLRWYRKAAESGSAAAQRELAQLERARGK